MSPRDERSCFLSSVNLRRLTEAEKGAVEASSPAEPRGEPAVPPPAAPAPEPEPAS